MRRDIHGFLEGFFIDRHLNRNVREVVIDCGVRSGFDGRVIFGVLMILCNGPKGLSEDTNDRHGEELMHRSVV
jgi:hypothetical protein